MRTLVVVLLALAGGFLAGILLSEVIGIIGVLVFQRAIGIKYLPVYTAILSTGAALVVALRAHNRAR